MVSASSVLSLVEAGAAFAAVILLYLILSDVYRSARMPAWMNGDVVPQLLCVVLTGAVVGILIAIYSTAMGLPFGTTSDAGLATGILAGASVAAYVLMRVIRSALHLRQPA
ncbi:hypothetical protein [Roseibium aggregatum]|uniref:Uncharacterized protein n=1 Tax=Roseibium aggregatum TaxID=187304 RepID=A0A926S457_9HYPH|nr:hypothetical protein [Roseibium aggregatum]MBD1545061.1 hypothetical protein [Roseibium aggregatum]